MSVATRQAPPPYNRAEVDMHPAIEVMVAAKILELARRIDDSLRHAAEARGDSNRLEVDMNPEDAFMELLDRVAALRGAPARLSADELAQWPGEAVTSLKAENVITRARPAASTVCPGCERECVMPVNTLADAGRTGAFIVCDKRSDINRVTVPLDRLEQWQASGDSIADLLAHLLDLRRPGGGDASNGRWEIGLFKGARHASHLVLLAGDRLTITMAGHSIALTEVLALEGNCFKVDKRRLTHLVDQPVAGPGVLNQPS